MSKEKPKSALATLLDNVSKEKPIEIDETIEVKKNSMFSFDQPNSLQEHIIKEDKLYLLDPNVMQPWRFADRPEDEMGDIDELSEAIKKNGQQVPILIRPIIGNSYKYEVIFGNRRWRACKKLGIKVIAIIKQVSDKEAALYQKEENSLRTDLSELAQARSYYFQIQSGLFKDEKELSEYLGITAQKLNDIMAFIRIPAELANAIPNLKDISRKTAVKIAQLAKNKKAVDCMLMLAGKIGTKQITSTNIEPEVNKLLNPILQKNKIMPQIFKGYNSNKKIGSFQFTKNGSLTIHIDEYIVNKHEKNKFIDKLTEFFQKLD